jgi:hypothetical protein
MTKYGTPDYGIIWGGANDQDGLAVTSITSAGLVATVTTAANHSLAVNTLIAITGANETNYNITARVVTVPTANTFTYALAGGAASPATGGTITWNIPIAGTQENLAAMVKWLKFGCKGVVLNETALPAANVGDRYVVLVDGSATGGIDAPAGLGIDGEDSGRGRERANGLGMPLFAGRRHVWGRIATAATTPDRCKKIIVGGAQYLNFTANAGDNVNVVSANDFWKGPATTTRWREFIVGLSDAARGAIRRPRTAEGVVLRQPRFCEPENRGRFSRAGNFRRALREQ